MDMKKYLFIAASALALASCSSEDFVGTEGGNVENGANQAINFGGGTGKITRAVSSTKYSLADLQKNGFWVYGTKHYKDEDKSATNDNVVYKNYYLTYQETNQNHTQSNTAGWEYVGISNSYSNVTPFLNGNQTIKYWDYSAKAYTFYAATALPSDLTAGNVIINKITDEKDANGTVYTKGYEVTLKDGANLDNIYFADRKVINKSKDAEHGKKDVYGGEVNFVFRNALSKVRVAMYETVPGYKVTINKFYYTNNSATGQTTEATDKFTADANNTPLVTNQEGVKYKVVYYNNTEAGGQLENQPKMLANASGIGATTNIFKIGDGKNLKGSTDLSTIITQPTYDTQGGKYTLFMPQADNDKTLNLKVDYTLTSDDNSGETIIVKGATATIPAKYLCWRPNYAYTYLFKISDNTNGSTGGTDDPAGLYPITFDASVVETENGNAEYISALGDATITTFAVKDKLYQHDKADYENGADLYATVVDKKKNTVKLSDQNTKVYKLTDAGAKATNLSEALVANWVSQNLTDYYTELKYITEPAETAVTYYTFENSVPAEDGKTISLGTATALKMQGIKAGTYVIQYKTAAAWTGSYSTIYKIVTIK